MDEKSPVHLTHLGIENSLVLGQKLIGLQAKVFRINIMRHLLSDLVLLSRKVPLNLEIACADRTDVDSFFKTLSANPAYPSSPTTMVPSPGDTLTLDVRLGIQGIRHTRMSRPLLWALASFGLLSADAFIGSGVTRQLVKSRQLRPSTSVKSNLPRRFGSLSLRAQEQGQGGNDKKTVVDKIASKGIWQFGVTKETADALAAVGWADSEESEIKDKIPVSKIRREDIDSLVQRAVNAEIFADDRSKQVCLCAYYTRPPYMRCD